MKPFLYGGYRPFSLKVDFVHFMLQAPYQWSIEQKAANVILFSSDALPPRTMTFIRSFHD